MYPVNVLRHIAQEGRAEYAHLVSGYFSQQIQKLQGIAGSPAPIGGTLVAGSVLVIHAEKEISGFHQFPDSLPYTFRVFLYQHQGLQHVVVNPRIPVIYLLAAESHPPVIIPCEVGVYQVSVDFLDNPFVNQRAYLVEFVFQEIVSPCHLRADVGHYQFDGRFMPVGQSGAVFLKAEMCRVYPGCLAQKPYTVYDGIHKSALSLYQFCEGQGLQGFVVGASGADFAGALKGKVVGGKIRFPFVFQGAFAVPDDKLPHFGGCFLFPGFPVGIGGIVHPALPVAEYIAQFLVRNGLFKKMPFGCVGGKIDTDSCDTY